MTINMDYLEQELAEIMAEQKLIQEELLTSNGGTETQVRVKMLQERTDRFGILVNQLKQLITR